jgi:hypothetical protein
MDSFKSGAAPSWAIRGLPRMAGAVETEAEAREQKRISREPTEQEKKSMAQVKKYRGSLDGPKSKISPRVKRSKYRQSAVIKPCISGKSTFQGSLYPPRATDAMDEFSRASVKSGVSIRTANLTQGRAQRMQSKRRAKSNKK